MFDRLISAISPHYCCACDKIGAILCEHCKYGIENERPENCIVCRMTDARNGICQACRPAYRRAWYVGERSGALQRLIGDLKFQNMYAAHRPLADLLDSAVDRLPPEVVVVPIPTVGAHVRQRGYDHALLIARRFAKKRGLKVERPLRRATATKQRDANRYRRLAQAKVAFRVAGPIRGDVPYLLIDDVITTGATMEYAARALRDAGAKEIWVAAVARQPLDE